MNAIEIKSLVKVYGTNRAVDGLSLEVAEGELFSLLGQNGAGKTTTIRMLTGLTAPTGGDALICGHSIVSDDRAVKELTNVSPQETSVAPKLTVFENLEFIAGIYGVQNPAEKAKEMIAEFRLSDKANEKAASLSGGQQRRLSIAMALISNPKVLFLDEPTLGLDVRARRELWKIIESLHGKITVVLTTHYLEEAQELSDRIAVMSRGKLMALGTPAELMAQTGTASVEEAFLKLTEDEELAE